MLTSRRPPASHSGRQRPAHLFAFLAILVLPMVPPIAARPPGAPAAPVSRDAQGTLVYTSSDNGSRVPDFSHSGYGGGGIALPEVPAVITVAPGEDDDTATIQAALDAVAEWAPDENGFRGAVLLQPGRYQIGGSLRLAASGVVLRGSGSGEDGTVLVATGQSRRTLIVAGGTGEAREVRGSRRAIADAVVPAGALSFRLESAGGLKPGDQVMIHRPSTEAWIDALQDKNQHIRWRPGSRDLRWDRVVVAVEGNRVTLDAPITTAIEKRFGGGSLYRYTWPDRVNRVGIENLRCESDYFVANPLDENHTWTCIELNAVEDAWTRNITTVHFAYAAVSTDHRSKRVTIADCRSLKPVSEHGEYRRNTYYVGGQQVLVLRCEAEDGRHDFSAGLTAAGPNAFVECQSIRPGSDVGPFESWASGVLYDNVTVSGGSLSLPNVPARGMGYTAANSVLWHSQADGIEIAQPTTARNWVVPAPAEQVESAIPSLYRAQLEARLGRTGLAALRKAENFPTDATGLRLMPPQTAAVPGPPAKPLAVINGRFVAGGRTVWGDSFAVNWWKGDIAPAAGSSVHGIGITRFLPGRDGQGFTDDLDALTDRMAAENIPFMQHWTGLWYDRRRDDHSLVKRPDEAVAPPFYEQPWARSGQGTAWDGLSKYDLTRYNSWYFERLREFARLASEKGLVLYHNYYNNHNFVESGAHWVDMPFRPANTIQETGLTEPPPFTETGSIYIADEFYDLNHESRRALHRAYMRKTLDELGDQPNVVHALGFQYAGPLAFQELFMETLVDWQRETGKSAKVILIAAKDVTDAILEDPTYGPLVTAIDTRNWHYTPEGDLWAPDGGQNLAWRELRREAFGRGASEVPPPTTPQQVYRLVREYRDRYPEVAVVTQHAGTGALPVLMAGGAQAILMESDRAREPAPYPLHATINRLLAEKLHHMLPIDGVTNDPERVWCLGDDTGDTYLVYAVEGGAIEVDPQNASGSYRARWIEPGSGEVTEDGTSQGAGVLTLEAPWAGPSLLLLERIGAAGLNPPQP